MMTADEWERICDQVAEQMLVYTRPFVTPLSISDSSAVRLVGTGSYVSFQNDRYLITCEHVAKTGLMDYRFYGSDNVFKHPRPFVMECHPTDVALAPIRTLQWDACAHKAEAIPFEWFAEIHNVAARYELLFFRGFSGENAHYGYGVHETNASGYCTQENVIEMPDPQIFEMPWEPSKTRRTLGTSEQTRKATRFDEPGGFSGSLVWNTRYWEKTTSGAEWRPEDAVVTGILRRFDSSTKTLLALRVEHLRQWLEEHFQSAH